MSPLLMVPSIVLISKFIISKVILSTVVVSLFQFVSCRHHDTRSSPAPKKSGPFLCRQNIASAKWFLTKRRGTPKKVESNKKKQHCLKTGRK